jgi:predicted nuclease of predicted toxin-antitoxin system
MKFLLDQDVYSLTGKFLSELGHDVVRAAQLGLSQASDEDLLEEARKQNRILVTRDRDYGNLVFVKGIAVGVLYLRMLPSTKNEVHKELGRVLTMHSEQDLRLMFVVVEAGGHRLRRIGAKIPLK